MASSILFTIPSDSLVILGAISRFLSSVRNLLKFQDSLVPGPGMRFSFFLQILCRWGRTTGTI
jgi:hypothetical protein